jgi:hypothetical protein
MKHKLMDLQQLLMHNNELTGTLVTSASIAEEKKQISETAAKLATCREARIINLNETAKLWNKKEASTCILFLQVGNPSI